jgi:hypothetical protein
LEIVDEEIVEVKKARKKPKAKNFQKKLDAAPEVKIKTIALMQQDYLKLLEIDKKITQHEVTLQTLSEQEKDFRRLKVPKSEQLKVLNGKSIKIRMMSELQQINIHLKKASALLEEPVSGVDDMRAATKAYLVKLASRGKTELGLNTYEIELDVSNLIKYNEKIQNKIYKLYLATSKVDAIAEYLVELESNYGVQISRGYLEKYARISSLNG